MKMNLKKKDEGSIIQYILAVILILTIMLLIAFVFSNRRISIQKEEIEDGITCSALASAVIDMNEYGTYKYIRSNNGRGTGTLAGANNVWGSAEDNLLNIFKKNLAVNLKLDPETLVANEDSIIDGEVKIINFWIYNKELRERVDADGNPIMMKDYKGRWITQHEETNNFYIYKYTATSDGGYNKTTELAVRESDGKIYTPKDENIIVTDDTANGIDGAGSGRTEVTSMTIYATIEFYVKPFGYDFNSIKGAYPEIEEEPGKIKIIKSVVVDVQPIN